MKALVVDNMSYENYLRNHKEGCCMFSLAHNGYVQEISNIILNPKTINLFSMPLNKAYHVKHFLERRGQIGRIKIIKQ